MDEINAWKEKSDRFDDIQREFASQLGSIATENDILTTYLDQKSTEVNTAAVQIDSFKTNIARYSEMVKLMTTELNKAKAQIAELEHIIVHLKQTIDENNRVHRRIFQDLKAENEKLKAENSK